MANDRYLAVEFTDNRYPAALKNFPNCPPKIYVKGKYLKTDGNAIAIVGSRQTSPTGRENAYKFSYELTKAGITIVSGLARGIDTIAHQAALDAEGRTIAVLGSGIDVIYPRENKPLFEDIVRHGVVITEFPLGTPPYAKNFLRRNTLIAALSRGVLVIEGRRRSGSLSTASRAANLGIDVFAIPGLVTDPLSEAPNWLIENGAMAVTSPDEILDALW